jgi:hypothetical protein
MSRLLRFLLPAGLLGVLVFAIPAAANHNVDDHSPNVVHVFNDRNDEPETGGFINSDLAFWENIAAAGNFRGFRLFNIAKPEKAVRLSAFRCNGGQSDVSFYKAKDRLLLFQSVDTPQNRPTCDSSNTQGAIRDDQHWEGIRIFDVTNPKMPKFIKAVYTDCGSHTHTTIPDDENQRAIIYVSSYPLSPTALGPACPETPPAPGTTIHTKISIIAVPDAKPAAAEVIKEQPLHQHTQPAVGPPVAVAGTQGCHDITAFTDPKIQTAAAACLTEGQLWDISDPANPCTLDPSCHTHIDNELVEIWHSSTFTWDAEVVLFGDEHGGGMAPGCNGDQTDKTGNIWFYDYVRPGTTTAPLFGRYMIPRNQFVFGEECTLHNFSIIPINDNQAYIGVSSTYRGGTTVFKFSNLRPVESPVPALSEFTAPIVAQEIGWYDSKDGDGNGFDDAWSSYWYNDYIYVNGGLNRAPNSLTPKDRGFDIYKLLDDDLRRFGARSFHHFNPQTQENFETLGG